MIVSGVFYHPHLANLFTLEILGVLILSLGWERDSEVTVLELVVFGLGLQLIFGGSVGE